MKVILLIVGVVFALWLGSSMAGHASVLTYQKGLTE